ncbi:hypothetical protein Cgig2_030581 [Carnegiea gigantea]|uniref:Uncharacterized protein n=1 Tax=Carnegiea gigantea TaxID=171969 RepID=A0A9Q1GUS5_9CARY|nr:hypothetical protein Cgig2_030581 [Carnegiea gigantea]
MGSEERDFSTQVTIEEDHDSYSPTANYPNHHHHHHHRCCFNFNFPCFGSSPSSAAARLTSAAPSSSSFWDRLRTADSADRWWAKPIRAFKKIREWSEIVAGPKWKTFIRRFNRNNHHRHRNHVAAGKFQYDPLSYALNFDEGPTQIEEEYDHFPDFSSRFAAIPTSAKSSMDLGKGAPAGWLTCAESDSYSGAGQGRNDPSHYPPSWLIIKRINE